jgi:cation-transporting ATPase E
VPGFILALAPGAPLARPGFTRRVLTFTVPAGVAVAAAALAAYAVARAAPGVTAAEVRTAVMLAVFAVGLWVLALVAGRPLIRALVLAAAMAGALVPLFWVPLARRILALQLPPPPVCGWLACIVLAAIAALTLWRRAARRSA